MRRGSTIAEVTPLSLLGAATWWVSQDRGLVLSGPDVTTWTDQGSGADNMTTAPLYGACQYDADDEGTPAIVTTGNTNHMVATGLTAAGSGDFVMACVWKASGTVAALGLSQAGNGTIGWLGSLAGNFARFAAHSVEVTLGSVALNAYHVGVAWRVGNSHHLMIDAVEATPVVSAAIAMPCTRMHLGFVMADTAVLIPGTIQAKQGVYAAGVTIDSADALELTNVLDALAIAA